MYFDGDFSKWFDDFIEMIMGLRVIVFYGQVFIYVSFCYDQFVDIQVVVVFSIGNCGLKIFFYVCGDMFVRESQVGQSFFNFFVVDYVSNQVQFLWGSMEYVQFCYCFVICYVVGVFCFVYDLFLFCFFVSCVVIIGLSWGIFVKFLIDYFFGDVNRNMFLVVVYIKCQVNELWQDGGMMGLDFDYFVVIVFVSCFCFFEDIRVDKRIFLNRVRYILMFFFFGVM